MNDQLTNIIKYIKILYQNGEYKPIDELNYLVKEGLLFNRDNSFVISTSWVILSHQLNEADFVQVINAIHPEAIHQLLLKAKSYAQEIALKDDKMEVFDFVDTIPFFAIRLSELKDTKIDQEGIINYLFKGSVSYQALLRLLKNMQLIKRVEATAIHTLSIEPDLNWINGRIISTKYPAELPDPANKFVLTLLDIKNENISHETRAILSQPWETFLVILGMIKVEYHIENEDGVTIRPRKPETAMEQQDLFVTLSSQSGKVKVYGNLNAFAAELCTSLGILLFPENEPQTDNALFSLLDRSVFSYNGTEYLLNPKWVERIYTKERFLKNKTRSLRKNLGSVIDKLRSAL